MKLLFRVFFRFTLGAVMIMSVLVGGTAPASASVDCDATIAATQYNCTLGDTTCSIFIPGAGSFLCFV